MLKNLFALVSLFTLAGSLQGQTVTFSHASSSPYPTSGAAPNSLAVADFNNDGALDVIVANSATPYGAGANPNYMAWLGLKTFGAPNGILGNAANSIGTGTAIPFFTGGATDRAINVAARRAAAGRTVFGGGAYFPAIVGSNFTTGLRNAAPWNSNTSNFTVGIGILGIGSDATFNPSGGFTNWVSAGDFNGEGLDGAAFTYVDKNSTTTSLNYISVMFGSDETLQFSNATGTNVTMPGVLLAKRVFVGDVNGDGKADLVVTTGTSQVVVFLSTSPFPFSGFHTITFAAPITIPISAASEFVTIGDVNGDGKKDLVVSTGTSTLTIIPGNGNGTFGSPVDLTLSAGTSLYTAVADFTHDGKPDIAVANGTNLLLYPGAGSTTFAGTPITVSTGGHPVFVLAADMNADGKADMVAANSTEATVAVLLNSTPVIRIGPSSLTFNSAVGGANPPSQNVSVVFDTGGTPTYTVSTSASWLSTTPSSSGSTSPISVSTDITGLTAGTYRGTVTVTTSSSTNKSTIDVTLIVAGPAGTLTKKAGFLMKHNDTLIVTGDFTGHGRLDLVGGVGNCGAGFNSLCIYTYPSNGDGTFGAEVVSTLLTAANFQPGFGAAGDFNGDGKLDFAVYNVFSAGGVRIFFGNGDGTFTTDASVYSTAAQPSQVQVGDFNNDGKPDIAVVSIGSQVGFTDGQIGVLLNNGDGTFTNTPITDAGAYGIVLGDFNRDGFLDMVVASLFADVRFYAGNGNGTFASGTIIGASATVGGAYNVFAGDFNNDGNLDVEVGGVGNNGVSTGGHVTILLGNGSGAFSLAPGSPLAVIGTANDTQVGDFNGDGNLDLLVRRSSQGSFTIMLGDGTGAVGTGVDFVLNNNSTTRSFFFVGDFNGDGKTDMIVPEAGSVLWLGDLAATSTVMSSVPATSAPQGQNVAFTETVTATSPAFAVPGGQGTITDSADGQLAQANLTVGATNGKLNTSNALTLGPHSLTASYAGDSRTKPSSTSAGFSFPVFQAHLSFTTAPVSTTAGVAMANIVVKVLDPGNAVVAGSTVSITISLDHNSISAGTATINAVAGVATFTGIKVNLTGSYTMTASSTGITSATAPFSITAGPVAQYTVAGFPDPATVNLQGTFTVTAQDAGGNTVTGYTGMAHFTSSDGAAVLPANYTFVAGDNGVHTFNATLKTVGTRSITATDVVTSSITGTQSSIVVQVGAPATLTPTGTPQSTMVNTDYLPMSVTLTDAGGNPISEQTITFTAPGSGASGTFTGPVLTATASTDQNGVATVPTFHANTVAGSFNLNAALGGVSTNFALNNLPDFPSTITITGGNNQSTAINTVYSTALVVLVKDQYNNPVPGAGVTFSMPNSGASATFPGAQLSALVNTNAAGIATAPTLTANGTAGAIANATAVSGEVSAVNFKLTNLTGAPAHLNITAGSGQGTLVGTAFPTQFTANVTDAGNNPIQSVSVTFTAPNVNQSGTFPGSVLTFIGTTDASGNVQAPVFTANNTAGAYNVAVTANSLSANIGLTNTPGPALMTIVQGDGQSAVIGADFATPLKVKIADSFGNPYSGIAVTFTPPSGGATPGATFTGTVTVNTDATGVATAPKLTANNQVGAYTVSAVSISPALSKNFNLSNTFGPPAILTATAGTPQSTLVNTPFAAQLSVNVTDAGHNALSGVVITFTAPATGASGVFTNSTNTVTAITDGSGNASAAIKANTIAGAFTTTAGVNGLAASYSLTNTAGPQVLTINGGNNQSAVTTVAYATPLSAKVADSFGNPYSGILVTLTAPASGASGTFANATVTTTATTNAGGIATASTLTANTSLGAYTVSASAAGTSPVTFNLSNITGPPTSVLAITGTPQSTLIGAAFPTVFTAKVTDVGGNALSGVFVTFAVTPAGNGASGTFGGTTTVSTNASGIATAPAFTANTVAGSYVVKATVSGLSGTFNLTNTPGPAAIITPTGTPQSAILNTNYGAFSAKITDASNNPISGLAITFTVNPVSGAGGAFSGSSTSTVNTDVNGVATAPAITANGTLGAFTITARLASPVLTTTFNFTNIVNPPAAILVVSGSPQNTQAGTGYPLPLTAKVVDANSNPLNNVSVTFTLPSSGPSATFSGSGLTFTGTTNSQGLIVTPALTANQINGSFTAIASTGALQAVFVLSSGGPPALTIDPPGFFFRSDTGLGFPAPQTANIENALGDLTATSNQPWAKVRVLSAGSNPNGISVSVDPTGLEPGNYFATITVISGNRSLTARVNLVVIPRPQISSGPNNLVFRYLQGSTIPPAQNVTINGLSRNVPFTLAAEQITAAKGKWLNVVAGNNVTVTPAILQVSVAPVGIDVGTYQGVVHVVAPEATNSPYDINVALIVTAPVIPPVITSIVNAASFQGNTVSGNEILALFGTNLACPTPPQVLVDGVSMLVLGGTDKQVNWVAPDLTGRSSINVTFACGTNASDLYAMKVAAAVPGIFTSDGKQVSAFNAGFTLNSPAIPIGRGKIIMLFGTGFGPFNAPDAAGLQSQTLPVTVTVGGINATVTFAGAAPGLPGVNQINVLIPDNAPTGAAVPIIISSGGTQTPTGLTVAIN